MLLHLGKLRQQVDHRRDQHGAGDLIFLDRFTESGWREACKRELARPEDGRREHRGKIRDMEDRRGVEIDAALPISHPVVETLNIRQHVRVRQHHTLRSTGRAAGIYQCQNRIGIVIGRRPGVAGTIQSLLINDQFPRDPNGWRWQKGMPRQPARGCIGKHVINLHHRKACVDRNDDDAEPAACVHPFEVLGTVGKEERQPVAGVEPASCERSSQDHDAVVKLAKSQSAPSDVECGLLGIVPSRSIDGMAIDHLRSTRDCEAALHTRCR